MGWEGFGDPVGAAASISGESAPRGAAPPSAGTAASGPNLAKIKGARPLNFPLEDRGGLRLNGRPVLPLSQSVSRRPAPPLVLRTPRCRARTSPETCFPLRADRHVAAAGALRI